MSNDRLDDAVKRFSDDCSNDPSFPFRFEKSNGNWRLTDLSGDSIESTVTYDELLPGAMKHGALLHSELSLDERKLCRYTFKRAGRLLVSSYEQWETGFLRERDPLGELFFWTKLAGFMDSIDAWDDENARVIVLACCTNTMAADLRTQVNAYFDASNGDDECQTAFRESDELASPE